MNKVELDFANVTRKRIKTPNDFVSHMLEHIAWRLGCAIDLNWENEDWAGLGLILGIHIGAFTPRQPAAAAMGMLDDGSAEALVTLADQGRLNLQGAANVDTAWFLSLRCEQLTSGRPLLELLTGLSQGLPAEISVTVCNLEDPHHTWEGVFRALGTALSRIFTPPAPAKPFTALLETNIDLGDIVVAARSGQMAEVRRQTAESLLSALVDFEKTHPFSFQYLGPDIAHYQNTQALAGLGRLLESLADTAGFSLQIVFSAKALSSSHVLLEDTGMALGKALREVLVKRMMDLGINGGGDSFTQPQDYYRQPIRVAVSVEGRKFWRIIPLNTDYRQVQRKLVLGQTVMGGLFSEDLDDFLDGLSWGLGCSIMIHLKDLSPAQEAWPMIFSHLGLALKGVFEINPYRQGVPPGVKANLS
jgi:imidazoleglycerol phosphate dehydratase HisB